MSGYFGSVGPEFWTRGSGKRLRGNPNALLAGLFLLTAPEANMVGLFHIPFVSICHYLSLGADETRAALIACAKADFAHYDEDAELAWIPNTAEKRLGATLRSGDKKRAWVAKVIGALGTHRFVRQFIHRYGEAYGLTLDGSRMPLPDSEMPHPRVLDGSSTEQNSILDSDSGVRDEVTGVRPRPMGPAVGGMSPPPETIELDDDVKGRCFTAGVRMATKADVAALLDHARDKGRMSADWKAALVSWIRRNPQFERQPTRGSEPPKNATPGAKATLRLLAARDATPAEPAPQDLLERAFGSEGPTGPK